MSLLRSTPVPHRGRGCAAPVALRDVPIFTWLPIAAVSVVLVVSIAAPATASAIALPLAVIGALIGVPHGAVDHLVPGWLALDGKPADRLGTWPGRRRLGRFLAGYAATAVTAAAALLLLPTPTMVAFLVLSAVHFGWGEVVTNAERAGRDARFGASSVLGAAASGLAIVGLLVWRNPAVTDPYLRALSPTVADGILATATPGVLLTLLVVAAALVALVAMGRRLDAGELLLLTAVFLLCPPLAAFGVYFGLWHAVRYTGRLLDLLRADEASDGQPARGWGPSCAHLARLSTIPTAAALLAVLAVVTVHDVASLQAEVSVLLAVTFPHAAVVARLDAHRNHRVAMARE